MKSTSGLVAIAMALCGVAFRGHAATTEFKITTLSSRADMISGGDVLVRVDLPPTVSAKKISMRLNGTAYEPPRAVRGGHVLIGLVSGLVVGENKLEVVDGSNRLLGATNLRNYPITGPIFSGPHEQPFVCETQEFLLIDGSTLGAPLDSNCSVKTVINYAYKSNHQAATESATGTAGSFAVKLKPLMNSKALPTDLAYTKTTSGERIPFVVRIETGTINRSIYQFAVLSDPTKENPAQIDPSHPPKSWNKRLLYSFGGGCTGGAFKQGTSIGSGAAEKQGVVAVVNENVVGKGYAEVSSTLNVFANNCNEVLAAETAMMVKDRFIKAYGVPDFTFGRGGSGGAEQQVPIADAYPGILDGIIPSLTFPDVLTNLQNHYDTALLNIYFEKSGSTYTDDQKLAVMGTGKYRDASSDISRINPEKNCPAGLPESEHYDPLKNRTGARCDVFDHDVNIYGRDPKTGFARRIVDNVGVQYGLLALNAGKMTLAQFLDLNEKIGGFDDDGNPISSRDIADGTALKIAYETDRMIAGGLGLGQLPIIDVRPYRDMLPKSDPHQKYYSFAMRDRLQRANGNIGNDVLLVADASRMGTIEDFAITKMDQWLTNLRKDISNTPISEKVRKAKPADLVDSCWSEDGEQIKEPQTFSGGRCNELYPTYHSPRMVAGGPISSDIYKCELKQTRRVDYQVSFSESEWARLLKIFPSGVCDWSKPGTGQSSPTGVWLSFAAKVSN